MPLEVPFRLKLSGSLSDNHEFQGYDGYMALAGFAWNLALISNYVETGKIRHRGEFPGRNAVRASAPSEGSVLADFVVHFQQQHPTLFMMLGVTGSISSSVFASFLWELVKKTNNRNLGQPYETQDDLMRLVQREKAGDLEALVAATEPAIRQTHRVIGNGAQTINIYGGNVNLNTLNGDTKAYVDANVEDLNALEGEFSVAAFNANSGYGSVFDQDYGRTIPISINRENLSRLRRIFTWGLDQYANRTNAKIYIRYWRILTMDGTPKRYVVTDARLPDSHS